jgi:hypothetical protein
MYSFSLPRPPQLLAILALGLLAACAQPFEARVQSFQSMPPERGKSFVVQPAIENKTGSLEFAAYAGLVSTEMQKLGFQQAASPEQADLKVLVDFGTGPGRERVATRPGVGMGFGGVGGWGGGWGGWGGRGWYGRPWGFYDPFWGPGWGGGWGPEVYSFTVYPAFVEIDILRKVDNVSLFEGRAETTTRVNDLPSTMPNLVTALFTDFPGASARSTTVKVPTRR